MKRKSASKIKQKQLVTEKKSSIVYAKSTFN